MAPFPWVAGLFSPPSVVRAYGAASFEEEKSIMLEKANFLVSQQASGQPQQLGSKTVNLAWELIFKFETASSELRSDREAVLAAVAVYGGLLRFGSEALRDDPEVVLAAAASTPYAVEHASKRLRSDKDFFFSMLDRYPDTLRYASEELRNDRDVVLAAVRARGSLQFASPALQEDPEVVLAAVQTTSWSLAYAGEKLRNDRGIVLAALRRQAQESGPCANVLRHASAELRDDPDIVLEATKLQGAALRWAGDGLKRDKDFVLRAVRSAPPGEKQRCYSEAASSIQLAASWPDFQKASSSSLTCRGEPGPVLTVTLSLEKAQQTPEAAAFHPIRCEVTLLSGNGFECLMQGQEGEADSSPCSPKRRKVGGAPACLTGANEAVETRSPLLEDLAKKLLAELPKHTEVEAPSRVGIIFNRDEEAILVSAWDWGRPISDFLPENA